MAEAVRQALMQHGVLMEAEALICATAMAGGVAAALPFLPQAQRLAITSFKGSWTGLASEFFRAMAEKIARAEPRDAGSRDENPKIGAGKPIPRPFAERVS
ncbi:MAG: hypothetical protein E5X98_09340, partial [Mesorhizobium sp.]